MDRLSERAERATHNIRHIFRARHHIDVLYVSVDPEEIGIGAAEWKSLMEILEQLQTRAAAIIEKEMKK